MKALPKSASRVRLFPELEAFSELTSIESQGAESTLTGSTFCTLSIDLMSRLEDIILGVLVLLCNNESRCWDARSLILTSCFSLLASRIFQPSTAGGNIGSFSVLSDRIDFSRSSHVRTAAVCLLASLLVQDCSEFSVPGDIIFDITRLSGNSEIWNGKFDATCLVAILSETYEPPFSPP